MKKIILISILLPLSTFASNSNCNELMDAKARKECLSIEKQKKARDNFNNFEKNNQSPYQNSGF